MQLTTRLSLVLCGLMIARPIAAAPTATDSTNEALSPRSGVNNGLDLGDVLGGAGLFGGVKKGNNYGNGIGNGVGNKDDNGIGYGQGYGKERGGKKFFSAKKLKAAKAANAGKHQDAAAVSATTQVNAAAAKEDANFNNAKVLKSKGSGEKEKAAKLAKHFENVNKHEAAAKLNSAATVKAAAAHEHSHFDNLAAKKLDAAKKKNGFGTFI
ncbi:hypothetical protein CF327_g5596 [Tilletia walkeri]|nr:hypothetical protein CF327_g5596 [Tilletia walkeri]